MGMVIAAQATRVTDRRPSIVRCVGTTFALRVPSSATPARGSAAAVA
jgi:hypothetical protein